MKPFYFFSALLALNLCQTSTQAQSYFHPDSTFGVNGYVLPAYSGGDQAHAVLVQPADQKIVVTGFQSGNCYVARFLPNGQADATFGTAGRTTFKFGTGSSYGYALALQADGKILVAGDASFSNAGLARLTAAGALDPTFDTDGKLTVPTLNVPFFDSDARLGLAVQPADQHIVLGITTAPDSAKNKVATIHRFMPNGSPDLSFSGDGKAFIDFSPGKNEVVSSVSLQTDGKIVVGVFASIEGGNYGNHFAVGRLLTNGNLDNSFGNAGINIAGKGVLLDLRIQPDGKIVAAGYNRYFAFFQEEKDIALMRFLPSGALDPAFGTGGTVYTDYGWCHANGMALQPDGKIVVAGFLHPNNPFNFLVGRYNANGSLDLTFRPDGFYSALFNGKDEELHKIAMQANGDMVAVGYYELGGQDESVMLRLTPKNQIALPPVAQFAALPTAGCAPVTVQFSDQSTGGAATSWAWQFPGGNPATSTAQNPTVTYTAAGTYSVTLTASNAAGSNTQTKSGFITVNSTPTAAFTASVNGATATFSNTSTNAGSYSWNFGDSQTSTTASPSHTYATDGTYIVTLTATNGCGTVISTQTVVIVTAPTANFTANNTMGCVPMTVQFTSTSSANTTGWAWQFPGGNPATSTAQNPTVTYAAAGTYSVTLTASNAAGSNTQTKSGFVTVNSTPTAAFTASVNGATATFSNTSTNALSYSWNFGDSQTSTTASPSHIYATDGTYTVTLTAMNGCGSVTSTQTVVIVTAPTANFTANNTVGCVPMTVQFTSISSANTTGWAWQFPGGNPATSTAQNPTVTYAAAGTYSVTLTASNAAGSNTQTKSGFVTVNPTPTAAFTASVNGATATFSNTSTNAVSYSWNFGDSQTSTTASPSHTYATGGTYTVTLTATNACGTATSTQEVLVGPGLLANFSVSGTVGCVPLTVQLMDESVGATGWLWTFPGGNPATSTAQNPMVTYSTPGHYNVTLEISNLIFGTKIKTVDSLIEVRPLPNAAFSVQDLGGSMYKFNNTSTHADSYVWDFPGGTPATSTETSPTVSYATPGIFTVTLSALNNCGASILQDMVTITSGTDAPVWAAGLRIFPNPAHDIVYIQMTDVPGTGVEVALFDPTGRLLRQESGKFGGGMISQPFDLSDLPPGLYALRIQMGEQSAMRWVVRQK